MSRSVSTVPFHGQNVTAITFWPWNSTVTAVTFWPWNSTVTAVTFWPWNSTVTAVTFWPWNGTVLTDLDIYTGFIPNQLMTNTSGCCYGL